MSQWYLPRRKWILLLRGLEIEILAMISAQAHSITSWERLAITLE
jgi:hypothetical protein